MNKPSEPAREVISRQPMPVVERAPEREIRESTPLRPMSPRPTPPMARPIPATKSPDDLKAILRTMVAKTTVEREEKQTKNQQSLKGTLADILAKNKEKAVQSAPEVQKPAAAQPPRENAPTPTQVQSTGSAREPQVRQPFEVSEDALRKVFKGES